MRGRGRGRSVASNHAVPAARLSPGGRLRCALASDTAQREDETMQGEWSLGARPRQRGAVRRGDPRPNARCTARLASALAACCCAFTSPACTSGINLRRLVSSESGAHMAISRWLASIHCTGSLRNETCRAYHGKGACGVGGGLQRCWCFGGRGGLTVGLVDSDDLLGLRSAPAHGPSSHWHVAVRQNRSDSFFAVFLLLHNF